MDPDRIDAITTTLTAAASRRRVLRAAAGASALALPGIRAGAAARAPHPFPRRVNYPGQALGPNHRTQKQQDDDVRAAYDRWKGRYLVKAGN